MAGFLKPLVRHKDYRGSFAVFKESMGNGHQTCQSRASSDRKPDVLRGVHPHLRHDEFFCVVKGHCIVALKDIRAGSILK